MKAFLMTLAIFLSFTSLSFAGERSPFTDVEYKKTPGAPAGLPTISVTVNGDQYYLLAVAGIDIKDIMSSCNTIFAFDCEDKFALNFLEVMQAAGVQIMNTVDLRLYKFTQHRVVTLEDIAVLEENIDEILFNRELRGE